MDNMLDTDLLRTFIAIADSGGFTRAAQVVHRSQSAVSMQMKKLEITVGNQLFEKVGRGLVLTAEGETLLNYARRILKLHEEALSTLRQPDMTGSVRIGIPDDYVSAFIPRILTQFARSYPLIQVEVICETSEQLKVSIQTDKIDLAIITALPGEMAGQVLLRDTTAWATSRHHCAHKQSPLPLVLFQQGCIFRAWAIEALNSMGSTYRVAYSSPSITGIQSIVSAGLGITVLAKSILSSDMRELTQSEGFPPLPEAVITLLRSPNNSSKIIDCMSDYIVDGFDSHQIQAA